MERVGWSGGGVGVRLGFGFGFGFGFGLGLDLGVDLREGARALEARDALVEERVWSNICRNSACVQKMSVYTAHLRGC